MGVPPRGFTARIERTAFRDIQREHDVTQQSISPCQEPIIGSCPCVQLQSKRFYLREDNLEEVDHPHRLFFSLFGSGLFK